MMRAAFLSLFLGLPGFLCAAGAARRTPALSNAKTRVAVTQTTVVSLSAGLGSQTQTTLTPAPSQGNLTLPPGPLAVQGGQAAQAAQTAVEVETVQAVEKAPQGAEYAVEEEAAQEDAAAPGDSPKPAKEKTTKKAKGGKSLKGLKKKAEDKEGADFDGEEGKRDDEKSDLSPGSFGRFMEEIGQVPLLNKEEEQALGTRIQAGLAARAKREEIELGEKFQRREKLLKATPAEIAEAKGAIEKELKRLERSREIKLWKELGPAAGDSLAAKDDLVRANLRLVLSIAKKFRGRGMDLPDLFQEGVPGLMRAADGYDPTLGFKFSTYATWWIRQSIQRGLADKGRTVRLPAHMVGSVGKLVAVMRVMENETGKAPSQEELRLRLKLSPEDFKTIWDAYAFYRGQGVGSDSSDEDAANPVDLAADHRPGPAEEASRNEEADKLRWALGIMSRRPAPSPRRARILKMRFGIDQEEHPGGMTLKEIGQVLHLTRERVRQLESAAMEELTGLMTSE